MPSPRHALLSSSSSSSAPLQARNGVADKKDALVSITNPFLQHEYCQDIPLSKSFPVKLSPHWRINDVGGLPTHTGLQIMGQSAHGPIFLVKDNLLLAACRFDSHANVSFVRSIFQRFFDRFAERTLNQEAKAHNETHSLHYFLFGEKGIGGGFYDTTNDRTDWSPALSKVCIPTSVAPPGPMKVDPPLMSLFVRTPACRAFDTFSPTKRASSSVGKKPRQTVQNPFSGREKRMQILFKELGMKDDDERIAKSMHVAVASNPLTPAADVSEQAQDLLAGLVMKDNCLTIRRHRVMNTQAYQATHISLADKEFLASRPPIAVVSMIVEEDEFAGNEGNDEEAEEEEEEDDDEQNQEGKDDTKEEDKKEKESRNDGDNKESKLQLPQLQQSSQISNITKEPSVHAPSVPSTKKTRPVPLISDWVRVFQQQTAVADRTDHALTSKTERTVRPTVNSPVQPSKPLTARTSRSIRSMRVQTDAHRLLTPRTAEDIVQMRHDNCLYVHHPKPSLNGGRLTEKDMSLPSSSYWSREDDEERSWRESLESRDQSTVGTTQIIPFQSGKHNSNYKQIVARKEQDQKRAYQGMFQNGHFFMSERDREIKADFERNQKRLAGPFKLACSEKCSAIALRKEGLVRPHGPFPEYPGVVLPEDMRAKDWNFVIQRKAESWIAGSWK